MRQITIFLLLVLSLSYNLWQYKKCQNSIKLNNAIWNSKSISLLYAMDSNNTKVVRDSLKYDIIQLIHDYNKDFFEQSKVLSSFCTDFDKLRFIKVIVEDYLKQDTINSNYEKTVQKNYDTLKKICK